jgi:hypothetical protein
MTAVHSSEHTTVIIWNHIVIGTDEQMFAGLAVVILGSTLLKEIFKYAKYT